tara:strand:+ start:22 stop:1041 length:1020 start_codon:yes stop_codon:yes gene_type:complete
MSIPKHVAKSAEILWLDALEAEQEGDREAALELAKKVVELDEKHADAWMGIAFFTLPPKSKGRQTLPDLTEAAIALSAVRRVVNINPEHNRAWDLGGELLVDHLGMLEHALEWWEERRKISPNEVKPIIEQLAILIRLGYYEECADLLEELYSDEIDIPETNRMIYKIENVRRMVEKATRSEENDIFSPQNPKGERWEIIHRMRKRKPMSQTFFLLTFVAPIVFLLGSISMAFLGNTIIGQVIVFILIIVLYFSINRLAMGMLHKLNRHALDLDRALDVETTSGKICIPDDIRGSKLYNSVISTRAPALKQRIEVIQSSNEKISSKWKLDIPFEISAPF